MRCRKQVSLKGTEVLSASEIGQYVYCSVSWYLQKCGYKPRSPLLDIGAKKHKDLGEIIDHAQINIKKSRFLAVVGYSLLIITFLVFLFEVIL